MYHGTDLSEAEQRARTREERKQIVERYDKGRDDGVVIDDWEDPKFEIYHTQDRYGFIHDQRLPDDFGRSAREQKQLDKEMSRIDKWLKMLSDGNKWFPVGSKYHDKMVDRVWKGVPERLRGTLWRILLDIDRIKQEQEGKYQEMKDLARKHSPDIRQIDLDVNRTYRNHIMFRERYNTRQQDLFHVLAAYSMYNTEVGYCQGMSQIAALLLMYLNSDEDAFWALSQLMVGANYNMHGFFIPSFPKLMRFQDQHDKILLKKLKRVQKHLMANNMDTGIYTLKWFFQCFLDRIPFSLVIRVWDLYLLEGESIMITMAYNILKLHRKTLLKLGMDELMEFLQKTLESDFGYEDDYVIETALKDSLAELKSAKLHTAGPPPDSEKPQKPFGLLENILVEEEEVIAGKRLPVMDEERHFHQNTLQREEENIRNLQHIDSQTSIDEGSIDPSLNETGSLEGDTSLDTAGSPHTPTPTSETILIRQSSSPLPPSKDQDELDDSLMFMMRQASIKENQIKAISKSRSGKPRQRLPEVDDVEIRGAKMLQEQLKKEEQRRANDMRRPASADPAHQRRKQNRDEEKRMSAYANIPNFTDNNMESSQSKSSINRGSTQSKSRSSSQIRLSSRDTSRLSGTSSEMDTRSSSRALNISSDSVRSDSYQKQSSSHRSKHHSSRELREKIRADLHNKHQSRTESVNDQPESLPKVQNAARSSSKSSYYFGEVPDLEEIIANMSDVTGAIDGDDMPTPINEAMPVNIFHNDDCYRLQNRVVTNDHMQDASQSSEVVCIKVPFSAPYEPLGPLLTTQHNIERLASQQMRPQYNGNKVTIQVNQEKYPEDRRVQGDSVTAFSPMNRSSLNFSKKELGSRQVTTRHITTKEKKMSSSGSRHTSTHSMYVSEHSQKFHPTGKAQVPTLQVMKDDLERNLQFQNHHMSARRSGRDKADRSRNGSRSRRSETPEHNQAMHNESYSSNEGEVWQTRTRSSSRNESRDKNIRKETFF